MNTRSGRFSWRISNSRLFKFYPVNEMLIEHRTHIADTETAATCVRLVFMRRSAVILIDALLQSIRLVVNCKIIPVVSGSV